MSRHQLFSKRRARVWMVVNGALLAGITLWVVAVAFNGPIPAPAAAPRATPSASASPTAPTIPDRAEFIKPDAPYFGLTSPQSPWSRLELNNLANKAGAHPTLIQFFVKWTEDFRPDAVAMCYKQNAVPVLSWEPWSGLKDGENQPTYALSRIASGKFDAYITKFATAVRDQKWPVIIRFAHEMNGNWYPWSEKRSGNHLGDYVPAWRHVHDLFAKVGATNVIWVWSPNIIRPVPTISLKQLYPGDAYVDWVGMVGYAVDETRADQVFDPTLTVLRKFTDKPVLITETGAQASPRKVAWTQSLFPWLRAHPEVVGFVWFNLSKSDGASGDWRFTADPAVQKAFHDGIVQSKLAVLPTFAYPTS